MKLDYEITTYLNQFAQHSWVFDKFFVFISSNQLLKGGVLLTLIWWAWFKSEDCHDHNREQIVSTLLSCMIALVLAKILEHTLPLRLRPMDEESIHFLFPLGITATPLKGVNSFPSDHAVLFFSLSTGLFLISRWSGVFALCYTIVIVIFPRLYLGLHYMTDIIAGAIIGATITLLGNIYLVRNKNIQMLANWSRTKPSHFYPLFFLLTYQFAELFDSSRALAHTALRFMRRIVAS